MVRDRLRQLANRLRDRSPGVDRQRLQQARGRRDAARVEREEDPAERAGREAMVGAPVDATLHPFGPAETPAGPQLVEVMAGGGPEELREAQREARGDAPIEQFAAAGGISHDGTGGLLTADDPLDVDDSLVFGGESDD